MDNNFDAVRAASEVVGMSVEAQIEHLERKYGVLAQHFFAEVRDGNLATDLTIWEFLQYQAIPLQNEIDSILDW